MSVGDLKIPRDHFHEGTPASLTSAVAELGLGRHHAITTLVIGAAVSALALAQLYQVRGYFDANRNQHVQAIFAGSSIDRFPVWDTRVSPPDPTRSLIVYEDRNAEMQPDIFYVGDTLFYYFIPVAFKALGSQRPFFILAIVFGLLTAAAIGQRCGSGSATAAPWS